MQLQAVARGAAVRRQWRHILAVLARYRAIAQVAVLTAEAAAMSRMEAERSKAEAEWEGMAAALIWQAVRRAQETEAKAVARRLVVVDASDEDADAATQTDPAEVAEVGTQTAVFSLGRKMVVAVVQTEVHASDGSTEPAQEVVVGRQLHPAQAKAVERAERAAERVEQLQAEAEARAARYRVEGAAIQEAATTADTPTSGESPKTAVGSGGKQRKKAQLRRQAAAEGVDVRSWVASKAERRRQLAAEAWAGMMAPGEEGLGQRITWAQENLRAQRQAGQWAERIWDTEASRGFWEAARGSRFSMLNEVE